jgi:hypothetical protein
MKTGFANYSVYINDKSSAIQEEIDYALFRQRGPVTLCLLKVPKIKNPKSEKKKEQVGAS